MVTKELQDLLKRAESWPPELQEQAVATLLSIEQDVAQPYELTADDKAAIERGLADVRAGRFMTDAEMAALFSRFQE